MSDHAAHAAGRNAVADASRLVHAHGQGFFDENVFARFTGWCGDFSMQRRGNDDRDRVDRSICDERVIVRIERTTVARGQLLSFLSVPATHGCEFSLRKVLNDMFGVAAAVFTGTNET